MTTTTNYHKEKYYCQICNRQCQDKDGFKCHMKSKTHSINMARIAEEPELYINSYSIAFEKGYLDIMSRVYENKWVSANRVYEEYKHDKESVQLSMTKWETLTRFIQYLANGKKCSINPSDNDILVKYIDNSITSKDTDKNKERNKEKDKDEKEMDETKKYKAIKQEKKEYAEANIDDMKGMKIMLGNDDKEKLLNNKRERIEQKDDYNKDENEEDRIWIKKGMIVRIEDKELDKGSYYKMKGKIIKTNEYIAQVELQKINKKITIDQYYLTKTLPTIGSKAIITSGPHQNLIGIITNTNYNFNHSFLFQPTNSLHSSLSIPSSSLCKFKE